MPDSFFPRLKNYYQKVGEVLRGESDISQIFPNATDIGFDRENIYKSFLFNHLPSKCNIFQGGFLFGTNGDESNQIDIIITTDTTPRFILNSSCIGKSFSPVDGTLGIASIKSTLNKKELKEALRGIASIPKIDPEVAKINPAVIYKEEDLMGWPFKVLFAYKGLESCTLEKHIISFYEENEEIPLYRRPDIIHVAGKYAFFRKKVGMVTTNAKDQKKDIEIGNYFLIEEEPDVQAIMTTIHELQQISSLASQTFFNYNYLIDKISGIIQKEYEEKQ